jgi:hypothetical protein
VNSSAARKKYLGVIVGGKLSFAKHVEEAAEKIKVIYGRLARQAKANRGMSGKNLMTLQGLRRTSVAERTCVLGEGSYEANGQKKTVERAEEGADTSCKRIKHSLT